MKILHWLYIIRNNKEGETIVKWNPLLFILVLCIGIGHGILSFLKDIVTAFKEAYGIHR